MSKLPGPPGAKGHEADGNSELAEVEMAAMDRTTIFVSYSHQDSEWLKRLRVHLAPLEREHGLEIWDDTKGQR